VQFPDVLNFVFIVSKGVSAHLLKETAKRRKSKAAYKEEKRQEELKQREIIKKLADYDQLKAKEKEIEDSIQTMEEVKR